MKKITKNQEEEKKYVSPLIEVIEVTVEEGFATSVSIKGVANDFTTNDFGSRTGGNTMNDF